MQMRFEFSTAGRIVFGPGAVAELPGIAAAFRKRARLLRDSACDVAIAIGGGSAIDAGKAIAALSANPSDVLEYLEIIGKGKPLDCAPCPFIAIPTTAGTGSEVTRNAVLGSPEDGVKASLRSPLMLPRVAIVDPDLTLGLPREITAQTGLDALTQLIEPYVSSRANPMTDALCRDGLRSAARNLPRAYANGRDAEARAGMSWASLLGGLTLANAGLVWCMVSRRPSEACSRLPTEPSAQPFCRIVCKPTYGLCGRGRRRVQAWSVTRKSPVF
jgi:alcohol dehydrogenase class IV